jgi:hypothetical protein
MSSAETAVQTLTEFLLARIAEDEYAARAFVNELGEARRWRCDEVGGTVRRDGVPPFGLSDVEATTPTHLEAAHIARHDPARVLAECEAKRRIVEVALPGERDDAGERFRILRILATVYADHPDYRDEWRP